MHDHCGWNVSRAWAEGLCLIIQTYIRTVQDASYPFSFGILYGFKARGDARKDSDIDLLVVSPRFNRGNTREDLILWCLAVGIDSRIEPALAGEREFRTDDSRAFIDLARRECAVIRPISPLYFYFRYRSRKSNTFLIFSGAANAGSACLAPGSSSRVTFSGASTAASFAAMWTDCWYGTMSSRSPC
jgi:predicted nucleotidyltransferase